MSRRLNLKGVLGGDIRFYHDWTIAIPQTASYRTRFKPPLQVSLGNYTLTQLAADYKKKDNTFT